FLQRSLDFRACLLGKIGDLACAQHMAVSSSPRGFDLPSKLILPVDVSRRDMKRHQPGNAGVLCERARLPGAETPPAGGQLARSRNAVSIKSWSAPRANSVMLAMFDAWKAASTT